MKFKIFIFLLLLYNFGFSQKIDKIIYKKVSDSTNLKLKVIGPVSTKSEKTACILFLSGGGWKDFSWNQLGDIANALSDQGMTSVIVEYRTSKKHKSTPFQSLVDVKDAVVFIRKNADDFNIDKNQIILMGISAGGHLAFSSYLTQNKKNYHENPRPNFIIALSPVIRNDSLGYGYDRIGESYKRFSPYYIYLNSKKKLPPSLIFSGEIDPLIKFKDLKIFYNKSIEKGDKIRLFKFENVGHSMKRKHASVYFKIYPKILSFLQNNGISLNNNMVEYKK